MVAVRVLMVIALIAIGSVRGAHAADPLPSADPIHTVLRLVPPETTICLIVRDLNQHFKTLSESPMAERFLGSALGKQVLNPNDLDKLQLAEKWLTAQLGVTSEQIRDAILGDAIVLAYQPGTNGKPDSETGIIYIKPRSMAMLQKLIDRVNQLQTDSGEIRPVKERTHRGQTYMVREKVAGGQEYYCIHDGVFAFSSQERAIKNIIELSQAAPSAKPTGITVRLEELDVAKKMAVCLFNPRGFDAELATKTEQAKDANEKAFLTQFRKVWTALNSFAFSIHPSQQLEFGVTANIDRSTLPQELQPILFPEAAVNRLWGSVPNTALFAVGGRINVKELHEAIANFLPPGGREGLAHLLDQGIGPAVGRDKLALVMNGLGPDWVFWIEPPQPKTGWAPAWTFALQLSSKEESRDALQRAMLQGLDFVAQFVRFNYNRNHTDQIDASETQKDNVVVKTLSNTKAFPAGLQPSYAVRDQLLMIASSPERVRNFTTPKATTTPAPMMRFSAKNTLSYLQTHKQDVATFLGATSNRPVADIDRELSGVMSLLEVFDRIELKRTQSTNSVGLTLQFTFVLPLAK